MALYHVCICNYDSNQKNQANDIVEIKLIPIPWGFGREVGEGGRIKFSLRNEDRVMQQLI